MKVYQNIKMFIQVSKYIKVYQSIISIITHIKKKNTVTKNIRANIHHEKKMNKYLKYQNVYRRIKSSYIISIYTKKKYTVTKK
jgi:uncharacterized protein (UPF0147 family)